MGNKLYILYIIYDKNLKRLKFSRIENIIGFILEYLTLYYNILPWLFDISSNFVIKYFISKDKSLYFIIRGICFLFIVSVFSTLIKIPFEVYKLLITDISINENHINNPEKKKIILEWILSQLKMFIFSLLFGIPILATTLALLQWDFPFQWFNIFIFIIILYENSLTIFNYIYICLFCCRIFFRYLWRYFSSAL